jgi:histidyl-tRNA synthetase
MKTELVKGFNDYIEEDALKRLEIKRILADAFRKYGFEPVETPVIEYEEFVRGDNDKDEAISDIFKLKDKGNRDLALRYEFTFQLKRLMNNKKLPFKRYEIGEVFRDEPVSGNRFRQFVQCDADIVGISEKEPWKDEAEILSLVKDVLTNLKIEPIILVNNRKLLNEILESEGISGKDREDVLREIDKYGKIPESEIKENLKQYNAENIISLLKKGESFFNKFESYKEVIGLLEYCKIYGLEKYVKFSPTIVRGLSYYNGTVYEIKAKNIKETIIAGGSYKFNNVQCTGISFGLERLSILSKIDINLDKYLVVSLEQDRESIKLVKKLRKENKVASIFYGKPSKALEFANSYKYNKVIFVGEKEVKAKKFKVKDMKSGKETALKI